MKPQHIKFETTPKEVYWAWLVLWAKQPIGLAAYTRLQTIIATYPDYFPWEHKYSSIPQEVHDAFYKECYRVKQPQTVEPEKYGEGILAQIKPAELIPFNAQELMQAFKNFVADIDYAHKRAVAEEKRVRAIWKKHYDKFGLEYRP
jgi:hypothetical protein